MDVFRFQFENVAVYRQFCEGIKRTPETVIHFSQIPFLPIRFFKTENVMAKGMNPEKTFESSGTTGESTSKHGVADLSIYERSFLKTFQMHYGKPQHYCILALLPSYLERSNSSLVHMAEQLMRASNHPENGFFMHNFDELAARLAYLEFQQQPTLLIGVTYALLDFAEKFPMKLHYTTLMETGGMKGRKKEMLRAEVHEVLCKQFGLSTIHAEYGMTELLSQAYSSCKGIFTSPPWMKVDARDVYNPMSLLDAGKSGALNIIDLANIYSCAFVATDDLGMVHADGRFEVMGRMDNSDVRGCSLMYSM